MKNGESVFVGVLCLLLLAANACHPKVLRYTYEPVSTKRLELYRRGDGVRLTGALVLIGPEASVRVCEPRELFGLRSNWRGASNCGNPRGPIQVVVPEGRNTLHLSSWNDFGEATSDYDLEFDFENGGIYEVFFLEQDAKIDWQLYSVSQRRYDEMHQAAPAELRQIPSSENATVTNPALPAEPPQPRRAIGPKPQLRGPEGDRGRE